MSQFSFHCAETDGFGLYILFNSISVISGQWKGEHEGLCAMKCPLGSERISPSVEFEPEKVGSANHLAMLLNSKTLPVEQIRQVFCDN